MAHGQQPLEHSLEPLLYDRKNASVSKAAKREAISAQAYGGSATDVLGRLEEKQLGSEEEGLYAAGS